MPNHSRGPEHDPRDVSVVVLNWNGGTLIETCLRSVAAQDLRPKEVVVVDNGSTDGSTERIGEIVPGTRVVRLGANRGYSAGMNAGIRATFGEFVLLLNLDVALEPSYLRLCARRLAGDPTLGGVTGKLLRPVDVEPPMIDTTGHVVYRSRRAVDRGEHELDRGQYDTQTAVFGVCGAAPMYRREMLDDVKEGDEYFDQDFFAYFEDFDLAWRARLMGWSFAFVPDAVGCHFRGASGGKRSTSILALNHVNRLFVMIKNDHPLSFLRHLPDIAYTELRATLHMLRLRPAALARAWLLFFSSLSKFRKKRRIIQARRKVGRRELEAWFEPYRYGLRATLRRAGRRRGAGIENVVR